MKNEGYLLSFKRVRRTGDQRKLLVVIAVLAIAGFLSYQLKDSIPSKIKVLAMDSRTTELAVEIAQKEKEIDQQVDMEASLEKERRKRQLRETLKVSAQDEK